MYPLSNPIFRLYICAVYRCCLDGVLLLSCHYCFRCSRFARNCVAFVFIITVVVLVVATIFVIVQCYSLDRSVVIATKSVESDYRPLKEKVTSQLDEINKIIIGNLKK